MTKQEIKSLLMHQTNNDEDDLGDFEPFVDTYIDEGYDLLVEAFTGAHVAEDNADYPPLVSDQDSPRLPEWTHKALCDWASWCVYRNGNIQKQNRGMAYRNAFEEVRLKLESLRGLKMPGGVRQFINIPE